MCCNKGTGKRGHIVADTLLPMMFLGLRKLGNICCGHKMFLNKIRNIFCVPDTKFLSATNVARAGKRGNICVGNNVSATMSSFARAFRFVTRDKSKNVCVGGHVCSSFHLNILVCLSHVICAFAQENVIGNRNNRTEYVITLLAPKRRLSQLKKLSMCYFWRESSSVEV